MSGAHGHGAADGSNKMIALLIAILALFLAFSETLGKSAQTDAIAQNVEASNLWAFFQAKTIRTTIVRTAGESAQLQRAGAPDGPGGEAVRTRLDEWSRTAARWDSEPETGEGRKELAARAKTAETRRDTSLARYHHYELASAAFQIGIVLASAMLITGVALLSWAGGGLGLAGLVIMGIGLFAPHSIHLM